MELYLKRNELELISRYKSGDDTAFRELYNRFKLKVEIIVKRYIHDLHLLKDYSQDIWLKVLTHLDAFSEGSFNLWISRIANNYCIDKFRRNKRKKIADHIDTIWIVDEVQGYDNTTEIRLLQVFKALTTLTELELNVILLRMKGLSFKSISQLNKTPKSTCISALPKAIVKIRLELIRSGVELKSNISLNPRKYRC